MRNLFALAIFAVSIVFFCVDQSIAVCVEESQDVWVCNTEPPNPDLDGISDTFPAAPKSVTVLPGAGIDTIINDNGENAIETASQADTVTVTEGELRSDSAAIQTVQGDDVIKIIESSVLSTDGICIDASDDDDTVEIIESELDCDRAGVDGAGDYDNILVRGSTITTHSNSPVRGGNEDDVATIEDSILNSIDTAVSMGPGNDRVNLGTGAELNGIIDCGSGDADEVAFQMEVPEERLAFFSAEIALLNGSIQTIEINGLGYTVESCEIFINELVGVRNVRPIPTLSEWGLIAMAGVLGIIGMIAVRRRATA